MSFSKIDGTCAFAFIPIWLSLGRSAQGYCLVSKVCGNFERDVQEMTRWPVVFAVAWLAVAATAANDYGWGAPLRCLGQNPCIRTVRPDAPALIALNSSLPFVLAMSTRANVDFLREAYMYFTQCCPDGVNNRYVLVTLSLSLVRSALGASGPTPMSSSTTPRVPRAVKAG